MDYTIKQQMELIAKATKTPFKEIEERHNTFLLMASIVKTFDAEGTPYGTTYFNECPELPGETDVYIGAIGLALKESVVPTFNGHNDAELYFLASKYEGKWHANCIQLPLTKELQKRVKGECITFNTFEELLKELVY